MIENAAFRGGAQTAWHKLGNEITFDTAVENLAVCGLDWHAQVEQAFAYNSNLDRYSPIDGAYSVNRYNASNNFMNAVSVVGGRFTVMQPAELAQFGDTICEASNGKAMLETGGCLDNGRKVWFLFKHNGVQQFQGDSSAFQNYFLLWTGLDGSTPTEILLTPTRVVCNNTLSLAVKGAQRKISVRHTQSGHTRLAEAVRVLGSADNYFNKFNELYNTLTNKAFTKPQFEMLVKLLMPAKDENDVSTRTKNNRANLLAQWDTTPGAMPGTAAGAINAISYYEEHLSPTRGVEGNQLLERRAENSVSLTMTQSALDLVLAATLEQRNLNSISSSTPLLNSLL